MTEWTIDGEVLPVNTSPDKVWFRIENDDWQWSFVADGKRVTAKLTATLGDETDPNTVDVKVRNGLRPGAVYKGIYRLDDDALKLCFSDDADATRPTTFESTEGSNIQCLVMRRSRSPEHKQPFREVQ